MKDKHNNNSKGQYMTQGERQVDVQDSPAFIRLESKVDRLTTEVREYKMLVDKNFVTRTEFEVFKASTLPNNKLIGEIIKYIVIGVVGAGLALVIKQGV